MTSHSRENLNQPYVNSRKKAADHGTAERWRHSGRVYEPSDVAGVLVARTTEEHLLDRLFVMGRITEIQRDAAFRFKADFHAAGLTDRLTGSYNPTRSSFSVFGGWDERSDDEELAYQRWQLAMRFLKGSLGDVMVSVICHDVCPDVGQQRILVCGLKVLVQHYGLKVSDQA